MGREHTNIEMPSLERVLKVKAISCRLASGTGLYR